MMNTHEAHASYAINLDTHYAPLERIDIQVLVNTCQDSWYNQTLSQVNDCVVRLGIMQGVFYWHKHEKEDEFFFVLEERFIIELEGQTVELAPQQGFTIPKGDQQGLGSTKRNKKRFEAQQMLVLLGTLAHNVVIWARRWLTHIAGSCKRQHYGLLRLVRDVFHVSGFLVFEAIGQPVQSVLNQAAPLAPILVDSLQELLAPSHVALNLGQT